MRTPIRLPRRDKRRTRPEHVPERRAPYRHLIRHPQQIGTDHTWPC